jgi:hypothetical protein
LGLVAKLVEQRLGLLQVGGVEALGEPAQMLPAKSRISAMVAQVLFVHAD